MDIQFIAVVIIGIAVALKLGYNIYRFFFVKRESGLCNGCNGCDLSRRTMMK